jgi:glycosyltransferase involved in cell wall biosynthesis
MARTSAIGRVTSLLVQTCVDLGHTGVVVRTEQQALLHRATHASAFQILPWTENDAIRIALDGADAIVYQIGNNYGLHAGALPWLAQAPGIVCLHDFVVAHLFAGWAGDRHADACRILEEWYGPRAASEFFAAESPEVFIDIASRRYPMTEWICSMAHGVVSHSRWGMARVARSCGGPLRVVPLPYDAPGAMPADDAAAREEGRVRLLTVGHINSNKRVESVIRAIGGSDALREHVSYRLCGLVEPVEALRLAGLARQLGVDLIISGEIEAASLERAMNEADIVCCLRWPGLEAASAAAIEALLYGKAVIVTDTGFYRELPDDCVLKIPPDNEIVALRLALEQLCADYETRRAMARRGQTWAKATFSASNYVRQLEDLAPAAAAAGPAIDMAQEMLGTLARWGASAALMTAPDVARPLAIFGRPEHRASGGQD